MSSLSLTSANLPVPLVQGFLRRLSANRRILSLADQAVISATNMCTTIMIGRMCPKPELGLYASGFSLVLLATAIQAALITVPYTVSNPHLKGEEHRFYKGSTILQQAGLSIIWTLAFLIGALWSFRSSARHDLGTVFLVLTFFSGFMCFREFARRISCAELRFPLALSIDGLAGALQLFGIGTLSLAGKLSAASALVAVGIASGIAAVVWLTLNCRQVKISLSDALAGTRKNWAFGKWLFSSSVLWSFSIEQYPWMLATARGAVEASVWASCNGVMAFLNPVVLALNNDAAPRTSHDYAVGGIGALKKSVMRSALIAALLTIPIFGALCFYGSNLVRLMYGGKFAGAGLIVDLLAGGFCFFACGLAFPYGMLALRRPKLDFAINVICFGVFLAIGIASIRLRGVTGAAYSFLTIQAVAFFSRVIGFQMAVRQTAVEPA